MHFMRFLAERKTVNHPREVRCLATNFTGATGFPVPIFSSELVQPRCCHHGPQRRKACRALLMRSTAGRRMVRIARVRRTHFSPEQDSLIV
jgi:hypothetical protein